MTDEKQSNSRAIYLKQLILVEFVIFAIMGTVWWYLGDLTTKRPSDLCFLVGAGIMLVGMISAVGTRKSTGNFSYQFANTASEVDMHKRVNQD